MCKPTDVSTLRNLIRLFHLLLIFCPLVFCFGCPLGGASLARGGRGGAGVASSVRAGTIRGTAGSIRTTAAEGIRITTSSLPARIYAARPINGASVLVRSTINSPVRAGITIRRSGLIEVLNPANGKFSPIGRTYRNGELWSVTSNGAAARLVGRIKPDGTIWQVNTSGNLVRQIGSIRATVTGVIVKIRSGPAGTFNVIGELKRGQVIEVSGFEKGWFHIIRNDGLSGWVSAGRMNVEVQSDMSVDEFKLLEAPKPQAEITNVWVEPGVFNNGHEGIQIHVKFTIRNSLHEKCTAAAYFYSVSGEALRDVNGQYTTTTGQVAVHIEFTPTYIDSLYDDLVIFMPYSELHVPYGKFALKFNVMLFRPDVGFFAETGYSSFTFWK